MLEALVIVCAIGANYDMAPLTYVMAPTHSYQMAPDC